MAADVLRLLPQKPGLQRSVQLYGRERLDLNLIKGGFKY